MDDGFISKKWNIPYILRQTKLKYEPEKLRRYYFMVSNLIFSFGVRALDRPKVPWRQS